MYKNVKKLVFMRKRVLSFALTINILFVALCGRLFSLSVFPKQASTQSGTRVRDIAISRGNIYDRNLYSFTNEKIQYIACIKPTKKALEFLSKSEDSETLKNIAQGRFIFKKTDTPQKYEGCEDIRVLPYFQRYSDNTLTHISGYTDQSGHGVSGIEKYYNNFLKNTGGTLSVAYSADANGRMMTGEAVEIRDNGYYDKSGLFLTIDKNMQLILEEAMEKGNIQKGAGVILNTQTNEILACASFPTYDRSNLEEALNNADSPFINRAFSAFPVGSVFKVVTAAASIENNIELKEYICDGSITLSANTFRCSKLEGHGKIDFRTAMAKSCNPYFIELGARTGGKKILEMSHKFHLGESIDFGNKFMTDSGILPLEEDLVSKADTGNLAFGQGKLTATPIQIASIFSAIGNGGYYITPSLIAGAVDKDGNITSEAEATNKEKVLTNRTCNILKNALEKTVTDGTGKSAQSNLYTCCTKTSTAQSGQYDENGNEIKFCWFVGFFPKENPQYTICIMKENGVSGGSDCGPVFKEIAENILFNF